MSDIKRRFGLREMQKPNMIDMMSDVDIKIATSKCYQNGRLCRQCHRRINTAGPQPFENGRF